MADEGTVRVDITMSLDGFIAGPNDEIDPLHDWLYDLASWRQPHGLAGGKTDRDAEVLEEAMGDNGAIVLGKRMYDLTDGWGDNPPFHVPVLQIHVAPVLLGQGIRLFDHLGREHVALEATRVIESPAVTHLRYRVIRGEHAT